MFKKGSGAYFALGAIAGIAGTTLVRLFLQLPPAPTVATVALVVSLLTYDAWVREGSDPPEVR